MNAEPTDNAPRVQAPTVLPEELALAALAFRGSRTGSLATQTKHLAWLPPDSLDLDLSDPSQCLFGDYKLVEKLGQGGMGVVYRAQQLGLDREVAIKLLSAGPWATPDFVQRFRAEAQSAARMQHPNIVPIYEIGVHDELVFYSMRLVRGPNLTQWVAEHGPRNPRQAAMDLRTIAEAVHYAHQLGVLHLDLKPDNILIDERGWPHVADFGLARRLDHTLSAEIEEVSGTPSYMAPELATPGKRLLTPATDIYGLGAIFYEMLTGIPPFRDASPFETLKQVREVAPRPPRDVRKEIPRDLEAICLKCLAKSADQRYASARELAEDLMRYLDRRPVQARPLSSPARLWRAARREPRFATALVIALVALVCGLIVSSVQWRRANENGNTARGTLWQARRDAARTAFESGDWFNGLPGLAANVADEESSGTDATLDRLRLGVVLDNSPRLVDQIPFVENAGLALSPDGALLVARGPHTLSMYEVATGAQRWSIESNGIDWVNFETDGNTVQSRNYLPSVDPWTLSMRRFRSSDGQEIPPTLASFDNATSIVYSKDGHYALVGSLDPTTELRKTQIWQTDPLQAVSAARWLRPGDMSLALSDDGSRVLQITKPDVAVLDRATLAAQMTVVTPSNTVIQWPLLSPDSRWLSVCYDNGHIELLDLTSDRRRELPRPFSDRINDMSYSEDSSWLCAGSGDGDIKVWETATGRSVAAPLRNLSAVGGLALDRRAHLLASDAGGVRLWSLPAVASEFAQPAPFGPRLVINQHAETFPHMGKSWLVTSGSGSPNLRLWRLPQSNLRRVHAAPLHTPDLDFDGRHLVAVDGNRVAIVDAWNEQPLAPAMEHPQSVSFAVLSADGATLVAVSGRELFVWDWRAHKLRFAPTKFANSPQRLVLNPTTASALVAYTDYRDQRMVEIAQVIGLIDGRALGQAVALPGPLRGLRFSADGTRLLYWRGTEVYLCDARSLLSLHEPLSVSGFGNTVADARLEGANTLLATTRNDKEKFTLWRLDPTKDALLAQTTPDGAHGPVSAASRDGRWVAMASRTGTFILRQGENPQLLPLPTGVLPGDEAAAFSPDVRLLAIAIESGVQIFDATNSEPLLPPLRIALEMHDEIVQLAFAPDGKSVLARTAFGRWLLWRLAPDARPAKEIARELDILAYANSAADLSRPLDASTRAWLRSHDPGHPPESADIDSTDPNVKPPLRDPAVRAELLDLSRYYSSIASGDFRSVYMFDLRQMPSGVQRLLGVDFDIRGLVQLESSSDRRPIAQHFPQHVDGIALPEDVAALDLLIGDYHYYPVGTEPGAEATLQYRDGGSLRVPLRYRSRLFYEDTRDRSDQGEPLSDSVVPTAWLGQGISTGHWGAPPQRLYLEHLVNPQPNRKLKSFSLVAHRALFLVAATVERTNR